MLTLENLLAESDAESRFATGVRHVVDCSLFASRLLAKDALLLTDLLENHAKTYSTQAMQDFINSAKITDEPTLKKTLRQLRQQVILRIIYRDLNGLADLYEVMQTTTSLAEIAIKTAVEFNAAWLHVNTKAACGFVVVGMGKLGGGELNVSSDVDLIFAFEPSDTWPADSNEQDFYNQLGKKVIAALNEVTEDGFVFRVDMRLRPFGSEGVLVPNLDALEEYYQNNGREWERYAWIKGRVIVGRQGGVDKLLKPFVFRKYLDYGAINSMRDLKLQIHKDVNIKGKHDDIKLGRGGIREIEFTAQVFQLIRGGQDLSLQIKPTLEVLNLLKIKKLLPELNVKQLVDAYVFLRNLEHRLMYVDDAQTQELPKTDEAKARIAKAMNFADWQQFAAQLCLHRKQVQQQFDATFNDEKPQVNQSENTKTAAWFDAVWQGALINDVAVKALSDAGYSDAV